MNYWLEVIRFTPIADKVIKHFNGKILGYTWSCSSQPLILFQITKDDSFVMFETTTSFNEIINYFEKHDKI